jgi:hypothetical protein
MDQFRNQEWNLSDSEFEAFQSQESISSTPRSQMSVDDEDSIFFEPLSIGSRKRKAQTESVESFELGNVKPTQVKKSSIVHKFFEEIEGKDKLKKHQCLLCK